MSVQLQALIEILGVVMVLLALGIVSVGAIQGMVRLALCVAYGGLQRTESRGCHARDDYNARNDRDWLNRTLATWKEGDSLPTLDYEPASKTMELPPGSRGYGATKIIRANDKIIEGKPEPIMGD